MNVIFVILLFYIFSKMFPFALHYADIVFPQIIDSFLVEARDALSIRPQTVEEIGEVNAKHSELSRRKPEIEPLFAEAERKNKLLRSVAGGGVEQVGELRTRWDKFEIMMESHQLMIKDQVRK